MSKLDFPDIKGKQKKILLWGHNIYVYLNTIFIKNLKQIYFLLHF